jgi:hypothetical protein
MNILRFSCILLVFLLFATNTHANDSAKPTSHTLELNISELKTNGELFPGAKSYSATLTNTTNKAIPLELVQYTPGYLGGAIFYPCAVQFWNAKTKRWLSIHPRKVRSDHDGDSGGQFLHSEINPNETIEVCRTLLVRERIRGGRCARFAFTFHWDHKPDILSKPFVIPDPNKPSKHIQCSQ